VKPVEELLNQGIVAKSFPPSSLSQYYIPIIP